MSKLNILKYWSLDKASKGSKTQREPKGTDCVIKQVPPHQENRGTYFIQRAKDSNNVGFRI